MGMSVRPADNFLLRWPYGGRVRSCDDLRCHCQRKHQRMEAFPSVVLTVHQPTNLTPVLLLASLDQPRPMLASRRTGVRFVGCERSVQRMGTLPCAGASAGNGSEGHRSCGRDRRKATVVGSSLPARRRCHRRLLHARALPARTTLGTALLVVLAGCKSTARTGELEAAGQTSLPPDSTAIAKVHEQWIRAFHSTTRRSSSPFSPMTSSIWVGALHEAAPDGACEGDLVHTGECVAARIACAGTRFGARCGSGNRLR